MFTKKEDGGKKGRLCALDTKEQPASVSDAKGAWQEDIVDKLDGEPVC